MEKYQILVVSDKKTRNITIEKIYDTVKKRFWTKEEIASRGLNDTYINNYRKDNSIYRTALENLKETLNWNLNGDSRKYKFKWGLTGKYVATGVAKVFD